MRRQRWVVAAIAATLAMSMAACASSKTAETPATQAPATSSGAPAAGSSAPASVSSSAPASGGSESAPVVDTGMPKDPNGTFIFGAAGAPAMFDPLYATDGETFRVTRSITEGLVGFKPGTADMEPLLAESWTHSDDGLTWTFKIRPNVTFSDGTPMDAKAACYNLDRMYSQTGAGATQAQYWTDTMGGFKGQKDKDGKDVPSVYKSCAADGDNAVISLTRYTSKFPMILGLPSLSMQSPAALAKYDANNVTASGDSFVYPAYALEHPTGTGPFVLGSYDKQNGVIKLERNDKYWGQKAKVKTLIFQVIPDETARKQALEAGTIDGYDLPNPGDWDKLKSEGFQVDVRPAFNILYLGFDFKNNPALQDLKVRQAIAYALNRPQFVKSQLPEGAEVALNWYPKTVPGWSDQVTQYNYDPAKAKELLKEAGQSNLTVNFWWPTSVSRPYMPDPKSVFTAFSADLEAVGIKVTATSKDWNGGYLDGVTAHQPDLFLLGWTGDFNTPDNFIGGFFTSPDTNSFDTGATPWGKTLSDALATADGIPDEAKRDAAYVQINKDIMSTYMPGVPISSSPPAIVVGKTVKGMIASPLTAEDFSLVYKG